MKMRAWWVALLLVSATAHAQFFPGISLLAPPQKTEPAPITLYGDVDMASAGKIITAIHEQNKLDTNAPILFFINSPGGEILAGGMIVDAMLASRRPIVTVDVGMAASMAAMIFEFGKVRVMAPSAILMLHEASMGAQGDLSHVQSRVALVKRIIDRYEAVIAARAHMNIDQLRAHEAAQWWLLGEEAVDAHVADKVGLIADYPPPTDKE